MGRWQSRQGGAAVADAKTRTSESITKAKAELDRALAELDSIRAFDPAVVGLVAHALSNYITVTTATVEMLQLTLREYPDPDVAVWLDGIGHAANLMQHSVGRLVAVTAPHDFPLKPDYVNLALLMKRACEYYRRRADAHGVAIAIETLGAIPLVWGDRVALAVVANNLLSNAIHVSPPGSTIRVRMVKEPGHVACTISDSGPGLTKADQARLFERASPSEPEVLATPGSGYEFATAREFIRRLDGELWCQSKPGCGASFSFRLPALDE